jgi:hypothetical protein
MNESRNEKVKVKKSAIILASVFFVILFLNRYIIEEILIADGILFMLFNFIISGVISLVVFRNIENRKSLTTIISLLVLVYVSIFSFSSTENIIGGHSSWNSKDNDNDDISILFINSKKMQIESNVGTRKYEYLLSEKTLELFDDGILFQSYTYKLLQDKLVLVSKGDTLVLYGN